MVEEYLGCYPYPKKKMSLIPTLLQFMPILWPPATKAMGIDTRSVNNVETLDEALTESWQKSGLHIIEAIVDKNTSKAHRLAICNYTQHQGESNETLDHGC